MKTHDLNNAQLGTAVGLLVVGCLLLIAGFIVPPPGEIHNSVLIAFGEILTWSGSMLGMRCYYANRERRNGGEAREESGR